MIHGLNSIFWIILYIYFTPLRYTHLLYTLCWPMCMEGGSIRVSSNSSSKGGRDMFIRHVSQFVLSCRNLSPSWIDQFLRTKTLIFSLVFEMVIYLLTYTKKSNVSISFLRRNTSDSIKFWLIQGKQLRRIGCSKIALEYLGKKKFVKPYRKFFEST